MAIPFTSAWWMDRLITKLGARQARYEMLDRYARSDPPMPPRPDKGDANPAFEYLRRISRVNWADIIVESVVERMKVLQFAAGELTDDAWKVWEANGLTARASQMFRSKAVLSEAYAIVGTVDEAIGVPRVTFEDARQVVCEVDPVDGRTVLAALKVFTDDAAGVDRAYLWVADNDGAWLHRGTRPVTDRAPTAEECKALRPMQYTADRWTWDEPEAEPFVPVVWFPNRGDLYGRTMGEYEHVIDDLDRIILLVLQRVQVAVLQAFRQRAVKGNLPTKDEYGKDIDYNVLLAADPGALWQLPAGVELWESSGVDLTPILESVKGDVRDLAGRTRTPLYYFYPNEGGSAEGATTQREGLVFRANSRITETSDPLCRMIGMALQRMGAEAPTVNVSWLRPDLATLSERYDAASKASAAGVPWRTVMEDILQFTPGQIAAMGPPMEDAAVGR